MGILVGIVTLSWLRKVLIRTLSLIIPRCRIITVYPSMFPPSCIIGQIFPNLGFFNTCRCEKRYEVATSSFERPDQFPSWRGFDPLLVHAGFVRTIDSLKPMNDGPIVGGVLLCKTSN